MLNKIKNKEQQECDETMLQLCMHLKHEKEKKRERALLNQNWDKVVDILSSEDEKVDDEAAEMFHTSNSTKPKTLSPPPKRPRVKVQSRNRCYKLRDEEDDEFHVDVG